MKISASVYSTKFKDLPSLVHELNELKTDALHIDCFDTDFNKVDKDLAAIRQISNIPIDFHAITENPQPYFELAEKYDIEMLTFQYENLKNKELKPLNKNFKLGISLVSTTGLDEINGLSNDIDFILLMTTEPGKSGGKFDRNNFSKIASCHKKFPQLDVHVDGGINAEISFILRLMGVKMAVSGSFLVNHQNIATALADLRFTNTASYIKVSEYMLEPNDLPIVDAKTTNFQQIVSTIHQFKMGFALIEKNGKLFGLTSNADLRRGILLKNNFNDIELVDIVNENPVVINENFTTGQMLQLIEETKFPIHFLPVVNAERAIVGCILFNQLMKG
jgi:ribulose-phosphate 3-epimerase